MTRQVCAVQLMSWESEESSRTTLDGFMFLIFN